MTGYTSGNNPILSSFRQDHENRLSWWPRDYHIEVWLGPLGLSAESGEYPTYSSIWSIREQSTPAQLDHARRVLTKLTNVYGEEVTK